MKKPKISLSEISQEIDLEEIFGVDLSDRPDLKQSIGQAVIDFIIDRTESRKDVNGKSFTGPYSDAYAESLDFKAFGKSKNQVNLKLTGDMINSLDLDDVGGSAIKIFVEEDQVPKAYNHQVGDTVPKREWFGISKEDLSRIKRDFESDLSGVESEVSDFNQSILERLKGLTTDGGSTSQPTLNSLFSFLFED